MRPAAANPRLDRQIGHPDNGADEKRTGESEHKCPEQIQIGDEMAFREPHENLEDEHDGSEAKSSVAVGASLAVVTARQQRGSNQETEQ